MRIENPSQSEPFNDSRRMSPLRFPPRREGERLLRIAFLLILGSLFVPATLQAAIRKEVLRYRQGESQFQSILVYDDAVPGKRPGILVCPEWWGLNDYAEHRAEMLAQLGYVALAVDLYGDGKTTDDPAVARKLSGELKSNRPVLRERINAALEELRKDSRVDGHEIAAIGYCFGGTTVLELARSGAEVRGVVAFHPGLDSPNPSDGRNIKGRVLVCYGANDNASSASDVEAFKQEMRQNNVDWQMNLYGNAGHSFTNPASDKRGISGVAYNADADRRSWQAMRLFLGELFPTRGGRAEE
jgi:dienelactone hydrolase